jgi:hypothetical protein
MKTLDRAELAVGLHALLSGTYDRRTAAPAAGGESQRRQLHVEHRWQRTQSACVRAE